MAEAVTTTDFPALTLLNRGKVRDVYATSSPKHLLFVATDRISAYDVIMRNVRPFLNLNLGRVLITLLSTFAPPGSRIYIR